MSKVIFKFEGDDAEVEADAKSLARWFQEADDLTRASISTENRPAAKGELGSVPEMVSLLLDSAPLLAAVLTNFRGWAEERIKRGQFVVSITCPNGMSIQATARKFADIAVIESQLVGKCGM